MTIDRSQGIDKEAIILVIEKGSQQLVENPRRLNVALTRAKGKLIVVGSANHLENMNVWEGSLAKLFRPYQAELTKSMIEDMIKGVNFLFKSHISLQSIKVWEILIYNLFLGQSYDSEQDKGETF